MLFRTGEYTPLIGCGNFFQAHPDSKYVNDFITHSTHAVQIYSQSLVSLYVGNTTVPCKVLACIIAMQYDEDDD